MRQRRTGKIIAALFVALAILIPVHIAESMVPGPATHHAIQVRSDQWARLNAERRARGLPHLQWNGRLSEKAAVWSEHMYHQGKLIHSDLNRFLNNYNYIGENIATGGAGVTSGNLEVAFMHSQPHRDDILSPGFTSAGIGVFCAPDHSMWITVDFGRRFKDGWPPQYNGGTPAIPIDRVDPGSVRC